jgi:hypothetical protein
LHSALRLYFEDREFFSVITLAGAAEEILGAHLKLKGESTALEEIVKGAVRISAALSSKPSEPKNIRTIANFPKNASKHMDGKDDATLRVYLKRDARDLLSRAVDNYYQLANYLDDLPLTELIEKFNRERVR